MESQVWTAIGAVIAGMALCGGFMAFVFKMMLRAELTNTMLQIADKNYLSQADLERHERQCPARCKEYRGELSNLRSSGNEAG